MRDGAVLTFLLSLRFCFCHKYLVKLESVCCLRTLYWIDQDTPGDLRHCQYIDAM